MPSTVPSPSALVHLRPTDLRGAIVTAIVGGATALGAGLSLQGGFAAWIAGQALLALAFVQWFVVLHECGHETMFRGRRLNGAVGTLAGLLVLIPFHTWRRIHGRHHKWTGWQDLDPTTEALVPRERGRAERIFLNVCWRLWVPVFSVLYRLQNFWHLPRVLAMFPQRHDRRAVVRDTTVAVIAYATIGILVGPETMARVVGLALVLSLVAEDLLLLSQHTHIPQHVSRGASVRPYPSIEQAPFTRSLRLPRCAAVLILNFDAHELHHMYPFVPGYHLHRIPYQPPNEIGWWRWVSSAKRTPADVLLFTNRLDTGLDI
jgi:omega-6 fatty acid desaturase (delta-12 desaturase)